MLEAFHFNLTALSYIALLVGLFLIYNTVSISVITRRE
jgi:putative ABC transport system permease protein